MAVHVRSVASTTLVLVTVLARLASGQRAESSIAISATIVAPVESISPAALAPRLSASTVRPFSGEHSRPAATTPSTPQLARTAALRYRVRLRLDSAVDVPANYPIVVRDADDHDRLLSGSGSAAGVVIARGATAEEAQTAIVRIRVDGRSGAGAGARAVHLVYEVTSESALTM